MNEIQAKLIDLLERLRDSRSVVTYFRGVDISTLSRKALEGAFIHQKDDHKAEMKTIYERRYNG